MGKTTLVKAVSEIEPLTTEERASLAGRYSFGDRPRDSFTIVTKPTRVEIARAGSSAQLLRHLGRLEFVPPGAPAVRIRFQRDGDRIVAFTVSDPDVVVRARRV